MPEKNTAPLPSAAFTKRSAEEAHSELVRELNVRDRCYGRWVQDGKLSRTDARDRYDRLKTAIALLEDANPALTLQKEQQEGEPF